MFRFVSLKTGILLSLVSAGISQAQTRFEWPSRQADVASYTLLDQCLGAVYRVLDSVNGVGALKDTLPLAQSGPFGHIEPAAVHVAQRCIASIPLSSVTVSNIGIAQNLLLVANRDSDVLPLYRKWLDAVETDSQKIDVVTTMIVRLAGAKPSRLKLADSLLADIQPYIGSWSLNARLDTFGRLCRLAAFANEDRLIKKYCGRFSAAVDSLSDGDIQRYGMNLSVAALQVERFFRLKELHDSLKVSSEAYTNLWREMVTKAFRGWGGNPGIGSKAEPVTGDYWIPETARSTTYPRSGKMTLVVGVPMKSDDYRGHFASLVYLRRLAQRFPSLEIVAMSGIVGHFGLLAPPPPAMEAELLYKKLVDFNKVPLVGLSVVKQGVWRLSDPDRRRILDPYSFSDEYATGYSYLVTTPQDDRQHGWFRSGYQGVLVDQDGTIIDLVYLDAEGVERLVPSITILAARASR